MHIPVATYRLQLVPSLNFREAQAVIQYLARLGISDLCASPIFKTRRGCHLGYDIVDPNRINPDLGTPQDFDALIQTLRQHNMAWLQEIAPAYLAYDSDNRLLMDVLENGESSAYKDFFEIDWDHGQQHLQGRLLAPFLKRFYVDALADGDIRLCYDADGLGLQYTHLRLPLCIESYASVLEHNLEGLEQRLNGNQSDAMRFLGTVWLFKHITDTPSSNGRSRQVQHAKKMLWNLYNEHEVIRHFIQENIAFFNGRRGEVQSLEALDGLIASQRYRLTSWKVSPEEVNYGRLPAPREAIAVRVENEAVYDFVHRLILQLIRDGLVTALQISNLDSLLDPTVYLQRLRQKAGNIYILVDKTLHPREQLPSSWPVQGTTGSDFMSRLSALFCSQENEIALSRIYQRFTGYRTSQDDLLYQKKRAVVEKYMLGSLDRLAQRLCQLSLHDRCGRDITLHDLKRALTEVLAHFPVYRTYASATAFSDHDRAFISEAVQRAKARNPSLVRQLSFIEKFLLLRYDEKITAEERQQWHDMVMEFQQSTAHLTTRAIEGVFFSVFNRLISSNEVGICPDGFGLTIEEFHDYNQRRFRTHPSSLNATTMPAGRRGEDVRARINVLSEMPSEWEAHLKGWAKANADRKSKIDGWSVPDENDEYFLYQTLIGAWPFLDQGGFAQTLKEHVVSLMRETRMHASGITSDAAYEQAYLVFIDSLLEPAAGNDFLEQFVPFQTKVAFYGVFNSLSQVLIKVTAPGVPDIHQGSELWDLSLTNSQGSAPVDFRQRALLLNEISAQAAGDLLNLVAELLSSRADGRVKLFLTHRLLQARQQHAGLFRGGSYIPVKASGRHSDCVIAYIRHDGDSWALSVAPRFLTRLVNEDALPCGLDVWKDTALVLPAGAPARWQDAITGQQVRAGSLLPVGEALKHFPVALLL